MSPTTLQVYITQEARGVKRVSMRMEAEAGDLAAALVMTAADARGLAQVLVDAAKVAESKIVTDKPLPHFTVHPPSEKGN